MRLRARRGQITFFDILVLIITYLVLVKVWGPLWSLLKPEIEDEAWLQGLIYVVCWFGPVGIILMKALWFRYFGEAYGP